MKLRIKTLSPVHIGSGESYNKLSLLQDRQHRPIKLHYITFEALKEVFNQGQMQQFSEWIIDQRFPDLSRFLRDELNDQNFRLSNILQRKADYAIDLLFEENHKQGQYLKPIEGFIKQNNKVYIPGSEIKGAIRTAVLYYLLRENNSLYNDHLKQRIEDFGERYKREIKEVRNKRLEKWMKEEKRIKQKMLVPDMHKIEENIQKRVFRCGKNDDAKYDLLKNLFVGDTDSKSPSESLFVSNLETLNINRRFDVFQELCKKGIEFTCQGFDLQNNDLILSKLGFSNEQRWVVKDRTHLLKCCYEFSKRLIEEEESYFDPEQCPQIARRLEEIKSQNKEDSPVIRIGKGEGYLSLTVGLLVKDRDKTLYNNVLIHATKNTSYTGNFPKTRRIVNIGKDTLGKDTFDTLGWVKLKKEEANGSN